VRRFNSKNIPLLRKEEKKYYFITSIHFPNDTVTYYLLQFDSGSPSTVFLFKKQFLQNKLLEITNEQKLFLHRKNQSNVGQIQILDIGNDGSKMIL
jgi:hypothetical protein